MDNATEAPMNSQRHHLDRRSIRQYCTCDHLLAEHRAGGPCRAVDDHSERCGCQRFEADDED